ncbi:MAG: magnesium chelatase family protein [Granulosicoccus sp.]|jgi:magnesium chelatase family protein
MSFATVHSCTLSGVQSLPVVVEVHIAGGLPGMSIVGLPESAVRESKDRVKAAIQHIGLSFPQVKIIVNLAPADLPKRGGRFDFPIALGVLLADGQLPAASLDNLMIVGELGLMGQLRSISGVLPTSFAFADSAHAIFIPEVNVSEALRSTRTQVHCADNLDDAVTMLRARRQSPLVSAHETVNIQRLSKLLGICESSNQPIDAISVKTTGDAPDMQDVFGQHKARRALEIAAAGAHNLLMVGPPGTGKSMLASRLPTIQPAMEESEAMETASVLSISHSGFNPLSWGVRPFRAPHHTASGVALVGGGGQPMPGEISLAHNGVLFLDELPEFSRSVLDVLREPMETGTITVSRAARQAEFPSRFQLVAAMNPCPCGYYTDPEIACRCGADQILRYQSRISGPFLDRIDIHISLQREAKSLTSVGSVSQNECSAIIRQRVAAARRLQVKRQQKPNASLGAKELLRTMALSSSCAQLFQEASKSLKLSLRSQHRLLRVARTIADLEGREGVVEQDLAEALTYRSGRALR